MIWSSFIFIFFYLFLVFSTLGYGLIFFKIIKINTERFNLGYAGLSGVFFLTFISFVTHLFFPHNITHNFVIHLFGLSYFLFFLLRKKIDYNSFKKLLIIIFF